jgi:C4-dicarboxylate-specific signal transduction histidine kinase
MLSLDIATLRFVSALELLMLPTLLWAFLRPGATMTAMRLWIAAGWAMALGNLLLLQWNTLTFPGKDLMIRLVFFSFLVMRIQSLRLDLGAPLGKPVIGLGFLAFVGLHETVRYLTTGPYALLIMTSMVTTLLTAVLVWLALCVSRREQSHSALWLAMGLAFYTVLFFSRVIALITGHAPADQMASSLIADAIALAIVLVPVVEHMGYLGICIERSRRAESVAVRNLSEQAEIDALRQQIAVLDRRRSLGEMAALLGHELKQPLTAVLSSAQAAQIGVRGDLLGRQQLDELLNRIAEGARRCNALIERIATFVRPTTLVSQPVDLNEVLREAVSLSEGKLRDAGVHIRVQAALASLWVNGDPIQLSQVVLNLIRNGIDASAVAMDHQLLVTSSREGEQGVILVRDDGAGFTPETMAQLGTPFFSTKPQGMGMGLAVSQSIARQHGGSLRFSNALQGGARVELRLPLMDSAKNPAGAS